MAVVFSAASPQGLSCLQPGSILDLGPAGMLGWALVSCFRTGSWPRAHGWGSEGLVSCPCWRPASTGNTGASELTPFIIDHRMHKSVEPARLCHKTCKGVVGMTGNAGKVWTRSRKQDRRKALGAFAPIPAARRELAHQLPACERWCRELQQQQLALFFLSSFLFLCLSCEPSLREIKIQSRSEEGGQREMTLFEYVPKILNE